MTLSFESCKNVFDQFWNCHAWATVTLPDNSTPPQQEQQEDPLQVVQAPGMTIWTF
jgi:hypothetical protein